MKKKKISEITLDTIKNPYTCIYSHHPLHCEYREKCDSKGNLKKPGEKCDDYYSFKKA